MTNTRRALVLIGLLFVVAGQSSFNGGIFVTPTIPHGGFSPASYTGPGDIVAGARAWWSCDRAYNVAYATGSNKSCNVRNTATSETCDILIATTGGFGTVTACSGSSSGSSLSAFCSGGGGTCAVTKAYDQSGNAVDISQGTAATQPTISTSIITGHAVMQANGSQNLVSGATLTATSQPLTYSAVANNTAQSAGHVNAIVSAFVGGSQPQLAEDLSANANKIRLYAGATYNATANINAFHAFQALYNGASSTINVDGTETTGNPSTGATSTSIALMIDANSAGGQFIGYIAETGLWPSGFSASNRTSVCQNQQAYYGSSNFGATC